MVTGLGLGQKGCDSWDLLTELLMELPMVRPAGAAPEISLGSDLVLTSVGLD